MNMSEKNQDQRPVYMGTFSKYTRAFESRVALMENDVEYHKKVIRIQMQKLEKMERIMKAKMIVIGTALLAMFMLYFLG
jgi:hypothetical protein